MSLIDELRFPIGKEEDQDGYDEDFSEPLKSRLIEDIKRLPVSLDYAIQNLDAAQLDTRYRSDGWTLNQVIHHIADSHINAYVRFKLGLTEHHPVIKPYDQDKWADLPDTQKVPVNMSITLLHALHSRWCQCMENMNEMQWQRRIYHPERKTEISLWQILKSYAWHGKHHTAQILHLRDRMEWN